MRQDPGSALRSEPTTEPGAFASTGGGATARASPLRLRVDETTALDPNRAGLASVSTASAAKRHASTAGSPSGKKLVNPFKKLSPSSRNAQLFLARRSHAKVSGFPLGRRTGEAHTPLTLVTFCF